MTDNDQLKARAEKIAHRYVKLTGKWDSEAGHVIHELLRSLSSAEQTIQGVRSLVQNTDGDWLDGEDFEGLAGEIIAVLLGTSWILPQRERNLAPSAVPTHDQRDDWDEAAVQAGVEAGRLVKVDEEGDGINYVRHITLADAVGHDFDDALREAAHVARHWSPPVAEHPTGGGEQP